ncbi:hypothetical protein [Palleronia caenipelagi]|uniref:Uncharacterized protein n=1 Tax=Palleronia caenipelagi TaxID=2489174 RepID=A0A547Q671_9RHOB|nr:hypothetical protein [Palleronia caenipelagi]TRD21885.1 hypothetical protein FEV53_07500 [Palleronia caenipelagi]
MDFDHTALPPVRPRHSGVPFHLGTPKTYRLIDRITGKFLHLSGEGLTGNSAYAWGGSRSQAETLEKRARARGEDWNFCLVARSAVEGDQ